MIKHVGNTILCFFLFVVFFIAFFVLSNKNLLTEKSLIEFIDTADILNINAMYVFNTSEDITVEEKIIILAEESEIPVDIIDDLLESEELKEMLGYFFKQSLNSSVDNVSSKYILDGLQQTAIISSNNHLNIIDTEEQLNEKINTFYIKLTDIVPEKISIIRDIEILTYWDKIFKYNLMPLYIIAVLLGLLLTINNKSIYKLLKYIGMSLLSTGIIYVIAGSLDSYFNSVVTERLNGVSVLLSPLITTLFTSWFTYGVLVSFLGMFITIIYNIIYRIKST